jgi:hypothetical protein
MIASRSLDLRTFPPFPPGHVARGCTSRHPPQMQTLCESWRRDLDALRRAPGRGSLWGGGRDAAWEDAGSVRVDASCFKVQDLLVETWRKHTPLHASQPPTLRPHTSYPPAPVTVAVREEERVVPIGRPVLLLAHLALEPGARGQRLVATQLGAQQSLCVYGSEEATVAQLRRQVQHLDRINALLTTVGMAALISGLRPRAAWNR